MFTAGSIIAGKFRIDRILGRGGMGVVVAATHLDLGQPVALKFLLPEMCADRAVVERFVREARAVAQLRGEHVCRVSDVGALEGGSPYIVMELLEGRDLASVLAGSGPLPVTILVDYVVQACMGLAEAHAAQMVHRDLKPANLFLTRRPDGAPLIKILDFGIAKAPTTTAFDLTSTATVMGSPGYMSPEQLRSARDTDVRSDIWSLGVILYELASGRPPFTAESITELALRVAMDPTPSLAASHIPRGFEQVVHRCLEKQPARRFPNVAQLASALAPFGDRAVRERALNVARVLPRASSAGVAPPALQSPTVPTTLGGSASSPERPRRSGARRSLMFGAFAAVVAVVIIVAVGQTGRESTDDTSAASGAEPASRAAAATLSPSSNSASSSITAPPTHAAVVSNAPTATAPAAIPPDAAVPADAASRPRDATMPRDAAVPADAAPPPRDAAPPPVATPRRDVTPPSGGASPPERETRPVPAVRKPKTTPTPANAGSAEDLGNSRF